MASNTSKNKTTPTPEEDIPDAEVVSPEPSAPPQEEKQPELIIIQKTVEDNGNVKVAVVPQNVSGLEVDTLIRMASREWLKQNGLS